MKEGWKILYRKVGGVGLPPWNVLDSSKGTGSHSSGSPSSVVKWRYLIFYRNPFNGLGFSNKDRIHWLWGSCIYKKKNPVNCMCVEWSDTGVSLLLNCITPNVWVVMNEVKHQRHSLHMGFPVLPYHKSTHILMFIHNNIPKLRFFKWVFLLTKLFHVSANQKKH